MELDVPKLTKSVRETLGTPFHHAGRIKGVGLDCGGMMVIALRDLGFTILDKTQYNRGDGLKDMVELLTANNFYQKEAIAEQVEPGDLVLIRTSSIYHHLVYVTEDNTVIHSWVTTGVNKVVETVMLPEWWSGIHSVWRFLSLPPKGLTWKEYLNKTGE